MRLLLLALFWAALFTASLATPLDTTGGEVHFELGKITVPSDSRWSVTRSEAATSYQGTLREQPEALFVISISQLSISLSDDPKVQLRNLGEQYIRDLQGSLRLQVDSIDVQPTYHGCRFAFSDQAHKNYYGKLLLGRRHTLVILGLRCDKQTYEDFVSSYLRDSQAFPPPTSQRQGAQRATLGLMLLGTVLSGLASTLAAALAKSRPPQTRKIYLAGIVLSLLLIAGGSIYLAPVSLYGEIAASCYGGVVLFALPPLLFWRSESAMEATNASTVERKTSKDTLKRRS